ncbi:hypothetical protein AB5I41_19725 [Sphingomonas sp. MMS24-JH45]
MIRRTTLLAALALAGCAAVPRTETRSSPPASPRPPTPTARSR